MYYDNGQKGISITYNKGLYSTITVYYNNGTPYYTQHYTSKGVDRGDIYRLSPSGKVSSIEHYVVGKGVVSTTWINEDGSTRETIAPTNQTYPAK